MKIGLALSGGGAIGAAHIGVLDVLEQEKISFDYISGTSAGAIIGLLYAQGGLSLVDKFLASMNDAGLFSRTNIVIKRNEKIFLTIESLLRELVAARHFYELPKRFFCVATDIVSGRAVTLKSGDPISAAMASAAYPGVFPIRKIGEKYLVDGGLTINLPASLLKNKADFVVGSSLYALSQLDKLSESEVVKFGFLNTAIRSIDIMSKVLADSEKKECNFCFEPPVETYSWYDFHKVYQIRELGQEYAKEKMPQLKKALAKASKPKGFWQSLFSSS